MTSQDESISEYDGGISRRTVLKAGVAAGVGLAGLSVAGCTGSSPTSTVTPLPNNGANDTQPGQSPSGELPIKSILVLYSYHHHNTEKVANALSKVLDAQIKTPQQVSPEELQKYDLAGFGSGIYNGKHHEYILDLADDLPEVSGKKAFIFSTHGAPDWIGELAGFHGQLKEKLQAKGYTIVDEFSCVGYNTNGFLESIGGINKGRPNEDDLNRAEEFARAIVTNWGRES